MKYFFILALLMALGAGCRQKISGKELENKLKETMKGYLDKKPHPGVVFTVEDVSFSAVQKEKCYICEFHVNMHTQKMDTTGLMAAIIPNDFSSVQRVQ